MLLRLNSLRQFFNLLSSNLTKWSNTLKQFVGKLPTNCLSVLDHFVGLVLKGLTAKPTDFNNSVLFLHGMKELLQGILFMLEETFGVRLWPQLN